MSVKRLKYLTIGLIAIVAVSCSEVPDYVIQPDDMASLLADIHIGEAVLDFNRRDYRTDSAKMVMLQSVLMHHGVDKHKLDTSFYWYGHHITEYMEVYDKTIELLEHRIAETGNRIAAENLSIAGDSVDIWNAARFIAFNELSPSRLLTFSLSSDENWEKGDEYTWRAKFSNSPDESVWGITTEYIDGSKEFVTAEFGGDGWREISIITDSTKTASKVYGYLIANPRGSTTLWVDSLMLVRNRINLSNYSQRFRQNFIVPKNLKKVEIPDSINK